jgi:hypothetical protein
MAQVPSMDQTAVRHFDKLRLLTATITTTTNNHSNKKPRLPPPPAPNHSTSAQPLENASTREISRKKEPAATFSVAATTTPADQNSNNSSNIGAAGFAVALCGMTSGVADVVMAYLFNVHLIPVRSFCCELIWTYSTPLNIALEYSYSEPLFSNSNQVGPHLRGGAFHFFDSLDEVRFLFCSDIFFFCSFTFFLSVSSSLLFLHFVHLFYCLSRRLKLAKSRYCSDTITTSTLTRTAISQVRNLLTTKHPYPHRRCLLLHRSCRRWSLPFPKKR